MVYEIASELFFIEELRWQILVSPLHSNAAVATGKEDIFSNLDETEAMTSNEWKRNNYKLRGTITHLANHDFLNKVCTNKFHELTRLQMLMMRESM